MASLNSDDKTKTNKEKDIPTHRSATLAELFSFATCLDKFLILVGSLAALVNGIGWPLMTLLFGQMTNEFVFYGDNTFDPTINITTFDDRAVKFEKNMTQYAIYFIYIGIGVGIAAYIQISFWQIACERQTYRLRLAFFNALLRQNIGWYDTQQSGNLTSKLSKDLEKVREGLGDKLSLSIQFLVQFVAGFVMGFVLGWEMTLVMMSLTPLLAIVAGYLGNLQMRFSTEEQLNYATAGAISEEALSCIRTVTSFNGQSQAIKKYAQALSKCMQFGVKISVTSGVAVGLMLFLMFSAYGLAFWYGSTQVDEYNTSNHSEGLSPGEVLAIFFSVMVGAFALGTASPNITAFLGAKGAGGTIFPIIRNKPKIDSSDMGGKKPLAIEGRIRFINVSFSYPTRSEAKILEDFSLDIEPGKTVAFVGASGCGKSTIVNLIQRFYDPDEGTVTLDDEDIRELNIHWLRGNIGIVSQEPVLFGISIADNIKLGKPGISMTEVEEAAKMANAHDYISKLPNKYDTLVGERGAQLSGGQKQRVAIARALVRDPRILLLDEATSALDSESQSIVQAALDKAGVGRTTVIIAHRLSTIQNANVIYVLDKGKIVEKGEHRALMSNRGHYYKLFTLQLIATRKKGSKASISNVKRTLSELEISMERSDSMSFRWLSFQNSVDALPKDVNLYKKPSKVTQIGDEDECLRPAGFCRICKSNLYEWHFILFGCLASVVNGIIFPTFSFLFSKIIETFSKTGDELLCGGVMWSLLFVALGCVGFVANVVQNSLLGFSGERLTTRLRNEAFTNIMRQDIEYFDNPRHSTGALTTRLAADATLIQIATGVRLAMIIQTITCIIAGLTIAFMFGWKLALVVLGGVPIIMLAAALNMKISQRNQRRDSDLMEEAGKIASECVENIRTVQGLAIECYFSDYYARKLIKPYNENVKQAFVYGLSFSFTQCIFFFLYAAAFRFGAWLVVHDGMEPDLVFRVFFAVTFTGISVGQAFSFLPEYTKAKLAASRIFKILDTIPKIDVFSEDGIEQVPESSAGGIIELKDVHFSYVARPEVEVLKGISLKVKPGQTAALIGMSGCGKSTIMSLIQRFYDPNSGSVLIQGVDVKKHNLKSLRSLIGVVSQEPVLFDTTIRKNIIYGLDNVPPMINIIEAAKTANAHDFIKTLPDGYETIVGEKGTQLSGGQKQRVAIARALIRNPKILLLDEATSALDTVSEKMVQDALDQARQGRTCIMISHRLSTIQNADIIYVMDSGQVVESGSHQELLARKGGYSDLVGRQLSKKERE